MDISGRLFEEHVSSFVRVMIYLKDLPVKLCRESFFGSSASLEFCQSQGPALVIRMVCGGPISAELIGETCPGT